MSAIREIALAKAIGGSGGGSSVTVEELTVNQNGTTTAPEGKAYNPVKVNVQPPLQQKTVNVNGDVTPDTGYYGLSQVSVAVPPVSGDGYSIQPVLYASKLYIDVNVKTVTSSFEITQNRKVIQIVEIPSYTGAVTFSDPEKYTVLYSDNTQGITRMILVNNDTLVEDGTATFTVTINNSKTIRIRSIVLSNVGNITFVRSKAQGAADSMRRCTVDNLVSGFAMYVCFGNVTTYASAPYDLSEQWYVNNAALNAVNFNITSANWPQTNIAMPATVFLKWVISSIGSVIFYQPMTTLDHPNVCELSLAIRE